MVTAEWTAEHKQTVRTFAAWLETQGMTKGDGARLIGVSSSTFSQMIGESYVGRVGRICGDMQRALRRARLRAQAPEALPYATTSITQRVIEILGAIHTEGRIGMILGPTGVGKSVGAKRYCQAEPDTVYLFAGPHCTPWALLRRLAGVLKLDWRGSTYDMRGLIAETLRGSGRLLIVDDVDYVQEPALQDLRILNDLGEIGVALIGTDGFWEQLDGRKSSTIRQVMGRVAFREILPKCSGDDLARIAAPLSLNEDALEALVGGSAGEARRAVAALARARTFSRNGVDVKSIRRAFECLIPVTYGEA